MTTTEHNQAMESERTFEDEHHHHAEIEQRQYEESKAYKIIKELKGYMKTIEEFDKDSAQDASALYSYLIELTNFMARANLLMSEWGKKFREEKKAGYLRLAASSQAQQQYFAPSLAKDYIDSQCSQSGFVYDLAERTSRLCVHTSDAIRTIISSLKSERIFSNYQT